MVDGADLIARARGGDQGALAKLFVAHHERLRALVSIECGDRLREHTEIEDIVQATYARACESVADFRGRGERSFQCWLFSIAKNLIREETRLVKRLAEVHDRWALDDMICDAPSAATLIRRKNRYVRLRDALKRLRPKHAEVIRLAVLEEMPLKEVAIRMGRSHGGVRNLLVEARKHLREAFGYTESLAIVEPSSRFLAALGRKRRKRRKAR